MIKLRSTLLCIIFHVYLDIVVGVHKVANFMDLQCHFDDISIGSKVWFGFETLA